MDISNPVLEIVVRFLLAMLPVFLLGLVCIGLEMKFPRERYSLRSRAFGFGLLVLTPGLVFLLAYPLGALWRSLGVPPAIGFTDWHPVAQFVIQLILVDFLRYAEHRLEHKILWPVHAVHHSVTELHAANSYAHPLMAVTEVLVIAIPLSMVDFAISPAWVFTALAFQNLIIHSPTRFHLGRWRALFVDNRYHRIHHSREPRHHERNFGFLLTIWDRLFGTYHPPRTGELPGVGDGGRAPPGTPRR